VASPIDTETGSTHLHTLAREPRPAGGEGEARAREYAAGVLRDSGFRVHTEPFEYSAFPGRYATPIGGAMGAGVALAAACCGLREGQGATPFVMLVAGLLVLGLYARAMLGDAVLNLPWLRHRSENLVATRGGDAPAVWLVAHLDSKSQPVPSVGRVAGIVALAAGIVMGLVAALLQLAGQPHRMGWWGSVLLVLLGAPLVVASIVGTRSDGAVDNASGVATVLLAASRIPMQVPLGVLLPSAEELGLAGARAWARAWATRHPAGTALNCDGVDDTGALTIMYSGTPPGELLDVVRRASVPEPLVRRMPLGLLTDSVAFADRGWRAITLSRGGWRTLRRVHTPDDSLDRLRGTGIDSAATLLVRAVEALA
jgi:hypothetical protein